jgi:DNA-binding winged helix-turn-helix (wHTH) protein
MQVRFGAFVFDAATRELRRGDMPVHVSPKAFDLLALLVRESPNAVSKQVLHRELWPHTFVSENIVAVLVAEIRRALGDSARKPAFVRTVNRFGYAFIGPTALPPPGRTSSSQGPSCYLVRGFERFRLHPGHNILGRDPGADVSIDAVGVSRQHAVIDVGDAVATLRDLSSKNGTFVEGTRVTDPVTLRDKVEVRLGAVCLHFRCPAPATATETVHESQHLRGPS